MKSLSVIHIISSLNRGGRERQLSVILSKTNQVFYPSRIIYFNESSRDYLDEYSIKEFSNRIKSISFAKRLLELNKLIKESTPDVIFTWGIMESLFILILFPFHKFKFINGSIRHGLRLRSVSHYFRSLILRLSPNIVANSYAGLKVNHLKRGYVLYNGIDDKFIKLIGSQDKILIRKKLLDFEEDNPLLISVANMVPFKDYSTVLYALKHLKEENVPFNYLILGDGAQREIIEKKIIEYKLDANIRILGNVQNVNDYLQISDIFIHSSMGEGCSNAILEAMAAALPIIATDTGGTSEIISEKNGFLFNYKDHLKLEELIKWCIDNSELTEMLGNNSLDLIKKRFTLDKMMFNYYKILNSVK